MLDPNQTIEIFCVNNNQKVNIPIGYNLIEVYKKLDVKLPYKLVAARVNNKIESLNYVLYRNKTIEYIDLSVETGMRVYVRSLIFVLYKVCITIT